MLLRIQRVVDTIGWSEKDLFDFLGIPISERHKYSAKKGIDLEKEVLPYEQVMKVVALVDLMNEVAECFSSKKFARQWFDWPNRALGWERPKELITKKGLDGVHDVGQLIGRIKHGIYS